MNRVKVYFRVDASERLGLGHLSRCRSLMLAFMRAARCDFTVECNNKSLVRKFISPIAAAVYDSKDRRNTSHFDIAIVDVPGIARKDGSFKGLAYVVVCIDDDGPGLVYQDILIRPNLLDLAMPSIKSLSKKDYWSGRDYIMLHPDFDKRARGNVRRIITGGRRLLVCFGGSDPGRLTLRVIPILRKLDCLSSVSLVLGAAFRKTADVRKAVKNDGRFDVRRNVPDMAHGFGGSDAALISGGTLLYEACASGVPAAVVSQNKAQDAESAICHSAGVVINLGMNAALSDNKIETTIVKLMNDVSLRHRMSQKCRRQVSTKGCQRIVSRLIARLKKRAGR